MLRPAHPMLGVPCPVVPVSVSPDPHIVDPSPDLLILDVLSLSVSVSVLLCPVLSLSTEDLLPRPGDTE